MAIRSKFRKLKSKNASDMSVSLTIVLLKNARVAIYSRILKEFHALNENFTSFFNYCSR